MQVYRLKINRNICNGCSVCVVSCPINFDQLKNKSFLNKENAVILVKNGIAFDIYDFLEDLFMSQTDLGYDNILIELWVEACKRFVDMKEKKYLLQSLEKLNTHLKIPQTNAQLFHYFYTCNYLWQFKSMFFSLEPRDFWRMMFYRALFEEKNYNLARKIIPNLDKHLKSIILDPAILYHETETLQHSIYSFKSEELQFEAEKFIIKQMIFRIDGQGFISYRIMSQEGEIVDGKILNEFWNDAYKL